MIRCWDREAGTSLLELLVAIALLAVLSVYAVGAIRYFRTVASIETRLSDQEATNAAADHIRRSIENMRAVFEEGDGTAPRLSFSGQEKQISFVTEADPRLEFGGLYEVRFAFEESSIVAHRRALRKEETPVLSILILSNVSDASLEYFGPLQDGDLPVWHPRWQKNRSLPRAVRLAVRFFPGDVRRWLDFTVVVPTAR